MLFSYVKEKFLMAFRPVTFLIDIKPARLCKIEKLQDSCRCCQPFATETYESAASDSIGLSPMYHSW